MKIFKNIIGLLLTLGILFSGYVGYFYVMKKPVPFFGRKITGAYYSIATGTTQNPLQWNVDEAKVFNREINNIPSNLLMADPFLHQKDGKWYAFFEIMSEKHADIGVAVEENGTWKYLGIALDEKVHLSYPFIFEKDGITYMIPETKRHSQVRLYTTNNFPFDWKVAKVLIKDKRLVDATYLEKDGVSYLFATDDMYLRLYVSDSLHGEFTEHPMSPVRSGNYTRSAGRIFEEDKKMIRFAQDHFGGYGRAVYGFSIDSISKEYYEESELENNPILKNQGETWAKNGMHHIDIHKLPDGTYKAIFDGYGFGTEEITFSFSNNF
ncbi:hypothetical protein IMCC3317_05640 [Kordia antarctica]|uniref:Glucosamine inositolphosphorylceramide transferase 1 N-terminal domain-containing protein n=1 Tax=Kordia antarctica TaxID=1218801 RepID=A0A7L4ZES2_9FLAO|nr:hypothetical protein [Kordia antarctica]QHI35218.1 hypothetical protein IMCC3317_05640 [Kordia antarctica]